MLNKDGRPVGYDFQKSEVTSVTIRTGPQQSPQTLSRKNVEKIEKAVKQIERKEK
jgi:hypothetical protein